MEEEDSIFGKRKLVMNVEEIHLETIRLSKRDGHSLESLEGQVGDCVRWKHWEIELVLLVMITVVF